MFDTLFSFVESVVLNNISSMVGLFADVITPLIGSCVTLYAIYLAFQALYDAENMMIMESLKFIGSLALCTTVAFNTSWYLASIVPMVLNTGDSIANILLGTGGTSSIQAIFDSLVTTISELWSSIDVSLVDGTTWIDAALVLSFCVLIILGGLPFLGVATAYLLVAKVMVGFLLILGPLFVMFAFFPSTRSMFQSWTGQCLNYILLSILYPIAFSMFQTTLDIVLGDTLNGEMDIITNLMTFILFFVFVVLSVQIPVFCSSLSGGVGINGLVSNMGMGMRSLSNAAKGSAGAATKAGKSTYSGAQSLGDKFKNRIRPG
ncbi:type IV secretion system protein [Vibrio campbellii]|uniref:type IV secretion system protein n=1 Tax=Vibrio campbellii TaxID=680 RepID=UPI0005EF7699|nr:type IV secretion system protein [Vibrio campbellii]